MESYGMLQASVLIKEVEKRPSLYDPKAPYYSDKIEKSKLWVDVARNCITGYDQLDTTTKDIALRELSKKWRNIRDAFTKELKAEARAPAIRKSNKRRYIYYHLLDFLRTTNRNHDDYERGKREVRRRWRTNNVKTEEVRAIPVEIPDESSHYDTSTAGPSSNDGEAEGEDFIGNQAFLMSFVPVMNSLPPALAMEARFQIAKVFRDLHRGDTEDRYNPMEDNYPPADLCDVSISSMKSGSLSGMDDEDSAQN